MALASIVDEIKRRNVHRAAVFYSGAAWLLVQVATQVFPFFDVPSGYVRFIIVAAIAGLPFAVLYAWLYRWTPQGLQAEAAASVPASPVVGRRLDRAIIAVLAAAVCVLLADRLMPLFKHDEAVGPSIAVLPLLNTTGEAGNDYLSDGLSDELIASLSELPGLRVIARTSSSRLRNTSDDSKTIGDKLGVRFLLEGSLRQADDRLRIAVSLVEAATGTAIWSERFERPQRELLAVQREISVAVADALNLKLRTDNEAHGDQQAGSRSPLNSAEAYQAMLRARYFVRRRNIDSYREAVRYFESAIQLDPGYAAAYTGLAITLSNMLDSASSPEERRGMEQRMRTLVADALRLAPGSADAWLAQRSLAMIDRDIATILATTTKALEVEPSSAGAMSAKAIALAMAGRANESVELFHRATLLDPLSVSLQQNLALALIALRRYDEATKALRTALDKQPKARVVRAYLGLVELLRGHPDEALKLAAEEQDEGYRLWVQCLAYHAAGNQAESDRALKALTEQYHADSAFQVAAIHAQRREPDLAFEWLNRSMKSGERGIVELMITPYLLDYRDDPRFAEIARQLGIPKV